VVRIAPPGPDVVSRYDDPPDEILDLGKPGRREGRESPTSLPPMHISDQPPGDDESADRPQWWQWTVLVVAVVAGLIVGVLGSNARRDAADLAAAESDVDLIVGAPVPVNAPDTPFQVPMYNAGPLEVELLWVRPEGWDLAETAVRNPITMPPDTWVTVRVRASPDCRQFGSPDVLELRIRTQAREQTISLPIPAPGAMLEAHVAACRPLVPVGVFVEEVRLVPSSSPDTLTMRLQMRAFDPNLRFALVDITASAPGFRMIDASVPVQFEPTPARSFPVDITWRVVGCEETQILNDINLGLEFRDDDGRKQTDGAPLPGRGVAELARFGVEQCGNTS
jgi:hypothetical protein